MLRIRLSRVGKKKHPSYRIIVADSRAARDGAFIEIIGHYDPLQDPAKLVVKEDRAIAWLKKGAQPSEAAAKLLTREGIMQRAGLKPFVYAPAQAGAAAKPKAKAKAKAEPEAAEAAAPAAKPKAKAEPEAAEAAAPAAKPKAKTKKAKAEPEAAEEAAAKPKAKAKAKAEPEAAEEAVAEESAVEPAAAEPAPEADQKAEEEPKKKTEEGQPDKESTPEATE